MNPTFPNSCSLESIHRYLKNELSNEDQTALLEHLDACAECRRSIEQSAGEDPIWDTVKMALQATTHCPNPSEQSPECLPAPMPLSTTDATTHDWEFAWISMWVEPTDDPNTLGRIGMFEALKVIGSGATGVVFLAREPALGREVAIKVLTPHIAKTHLARQRFEREARATAGLVHPNIIPIYQVSEWKGLPFLVMQHFPESSLQSHLKKHEKLSVEASLQLALEIAQGLTQAHSQGIIHRDIKPANILLSHGAQRAVLSDFGLAQVKDDLALTSSGVLAGTPHFMSPEQSRGEELDERSDLYSLGSVLFTMLAGKPPLHADSESLAIQRLASGSLPSIREVEPSLPVWIVEFIDCLLSPSKERRPANAEEVVAWLTKSIAYTSEPTMHPQPVSILTEGQTMNRPRSKWAFKAVLSTLVIIALGVLLSQAWRLDWRNRPSDETSRKWAEYRAKNRWLHFVSESNESPYELVEVIVVRQDDPLTAENGFPQKLQVVIPGQGPAPKGTFYFELPLDQKYTVQSTWRLRSNHRVDSPIIQLKDNFTWDRNRHDRVALMPPDLRSNAP